MQCSDHQRWKQWLWGVIAGAFSAFLYAAAFPEPGVAEAAWVFAVPLLLWAMLRPPLLVFGITVLLSSWLSWLVGLFWVRHVTLAGAFILSLIMAFFPLLWFLAARHLLRPQFVKKQGNRLLTMLGLASLWVLLEWVRTWLFTGFPWMTLSATQWERPAILQVAAWTGAWGISFIVIFFNLGLAFYLRNLILGFTSAKPQKKAWWQRLCAEFYVALGLTVGALLLFTANLPQKSDQELLFTAGFVQPWTPPKEKWTKARASWDSLQLQTLAVNASNPDLILWPEAAPPFWVLNKHSEEPRLLTERFVRQLGVPLLTGSLAELPDERAYNAIFLVTPEDGLMSQFHGKTHLVPFGEYNPLSFLPKIGPMALIQEDFDAGEEPTILPVPVNGRNLIAGPLVCFEDIFPSISRELTQKGADFLFVATNNAWHGQEGSAYQHAAHSALRAVENRRPVVRCGNHGWSGWFDEYGQKRFVLTGETGSIYMRGSAAAPVYRSAAFAQQQSFYTRYGDWLVALCALLVVVLFWIQRKASC